MDDLIDIDIDILAWLDELASAPEYGLADEGDDPDAALADEVAS